MLWLRNCLSTGISGFLDTMIFWSIAFHGLKLLIALVDTPFTYLARRITPADLQSGRTQPAKERNNR